MFLLIYLLLAGLLIAVSIANGVLTILKVLISDFFFHVVQMDQVDQGGQGGQVKVVRVVRVFSIKAS